MKKAASDAAGPDASPAKSALEDLEYTRTVFRELTERYASNVEGEITRVRTMILEQGGKLTPVVLRDLREIIGLLRRLEIKPEKGRRKDLKKVESAIQSALDLAEGW